MSEPSSPARRVAARPAAGVAGASPARNAGTLGRHAEAILRNLNTALLVVDTGGQVSGANPPAAAILGEAVEGLPGRVVWDWFPDTPRDELPFARSLREGARVCGAELTLTRRDGQRVPIGVSSGPLLEADGSPLGAVATFQDLSGIRRLQRQVLHAEKMASIGRLAAGVAHEINNPMGFIHANLFQLEEYLADLRRLWEAVAELRQAAGASVDARLRDARGRLDALARQVDADFLLGDAAKAVRESLEGAERIRHIVQDLRVFADPHEGEPVPADLNRVLDATARIVWPTLKHTVVLRKEYGELPLVRCRPTQLQQVFMNLLVNAHQAIQERLRTEAGQGEIVLRTEPVPEGVRVAVSDDGIGLPPGPGERVFEPFFTTRPAGEGPGLGLSAAYDVVRRHGGTLRAEGRPGGGCTFEVRLPCEGGPPPDPGP